MSETSLTPSRLFQALAVEMATAVAALLGESTDDDARRAAGRDGVARYG